MTIRTYRDNENDILQVEDQGAGMDEQLVKKLGIPFVTTKDNRVGLGLAMVYNIAKRHNAKIEVATRQTGTIVKVIFKGDKSQ